METRYREGAVLAVVAAITVFFGSSYVFFHDYEPVCRAMLDNGNPTGHTIATHLFPFLTDLGLAVGVLWVVSAIGFLVRKGWATGIGLVACTMNVYAGFMPIPPTASNGIFPVSAVLVFLPSILFFFLLTLRVARLPGWLVLIHFGAALAMTFCLINGVACTHRMLQGRGLVYIFVERVHFVLAAGWLVFSAALLARKGWARYLGFFVGFGALVLGSSVAVVDSIALGRFSFFGVSPLFSLLMLLFLGLGPTSGAMKAWLAGHL